MNSSVLPSWLRPMRRHDREIVDSECVWEIIRRAEVCRVAFCGGDWPYIVPMSFGILNETLYFHCASDGVKLDLLKANPNVCFEVETGVQVVPGDQACGWSVRYQSVIGFGRASLVEDVDEKRAGLKALLARYEVLAQYKTDGVLAQYKTDGETEIPQNILSETTIFRVDIHSLTGKESTGH